MLVWNVLIVNFPDLYAQMNFVGTVAWIHKETHFLLHCIGQMVYIC